MKKLSAFENEVLDLIRNDYEAPHTLAGDLTRILGRAVSESEVLHALLSLARAGLAQAFVYAPEAGVYKPVAHEVAAVTPAVWFMCAAPDTEAINNAI